MVMKDMKIIHNKYGGYWRKFFAFIVGFILGYIIAMKFNKTKKTK